MLILYSGRNRKFTTKKTKNTKIIRTLFAAFVRFVVKTVMRLVFGQLLRGIQDIFILNKITFQALTSSHKKRTIPPLYLALTGIQKISGDKSG